MIPLSISCRFTLAAAVLGLALSLLRGEAQEAVSQIRTGRVLVVAEETSALSMQIAAEYRRSRGLPPANLLLVHAASPTTISPADFTKKLLEPLRQRLRVLGGAQIDYVVLCRDVPYRTAGVSLPSALMVDGLENLQAGHGWFNRRAAFESCIPFHGQILRPTAVLSAYNAAEALDLVAGGQARYPSLNKAGRFYFCDGVAERGIYRNPQIPAALAALTRAGARCERIREPSPTQADDILGQFTGSTWLTLDGNRYLPGSILDNLTSYGGYLLDNSGQVDLLSFVQHGVCGAYGTVSEPTNIPTRWADYSLPLRYAAGSSLMESYLQTVLDWKCGIVVGDPLMAPFGKAPKLTLEPEKAVFAAGEAPTLKLTVEEAVPGAGLAWIDVWLNDQDRMISFLPPVPEGTTVSIAIATTGSTLYEKSVVAGRGASLPATLRHLAGANAAAGVEALVTGKRGNKILCRWRVPGPMVSSREPAAVARILLQAATTGTGGTQARGLAFEEPLYPSPVFAHVAVADFGACEPAFRDQVIFSQKNVKAETLCAPDDTPTRFRAKILQSLAQLPALGPRGSLQAEWRSGKPGPDKPERWYLWIIPRPDTLSTPRPELVVEVHKGQPESAFSVQPSGRLEWQSGPAFMIAETVIQPALPVNQIATRLTMPPARCWPGWNTVRVQAGSMQGSDESFVDTGFAVNPAACPTIRTDSTAISFRSDFVIQTSSLPALAGAQPELLVDGRPGVAAWPPGSTRLPVRAILPWLSPGVHQIQVQWNANPAPRSPVFPYLPLARSVPLAIRILNPLPEQVSFFPVKIPAGQKPTIQLRGPYLRQGLSLVVNGRAYPIRRHPQVGLNWSAELDPLPAGAYRLEITGENPALETGGTLPVLLQIEPKP